MHVVVLSPHSYKRPESDKEVKMSVARFFPESRLVLGWRSRHRNLAEMFGKRGAGGLRKNGADCAEWPCGYHCCLPAGHLRQEQKSSSSPPSAK